MEMLDMELPINRRELNRREEELSVTKNPLQDADACFALS